MLLVPGWPVLAGFVSLKGALPPRCRQGRGKGGGCWHTASHPGPSRVLSSVIKGCL